jgi:hypothetical protein
VLNTVINFQVLHSFLSLLSQVLQLSWDVPVDAGFLCNNAAVLSVAINKDPVLAYMGYDQLSN